MQGALGISYEWLKLDYLASPAMVNVQTDVAFEGKPEETGAVAEDLSEDRLRDNLHIFDSLSSPDEDEYFYDHARDTSPRTYDTSYRPDEEPYDRELGGFRKYDVNLDSDDEQRDEEDDSSSLNAALEPSHHSSEGGTSTLNASNRKASEEKIITVEELARNPKGGGIGKGGTSATLVHVYSAGQTQTSLDEHSDASLSQTARIGKSAALSSSRNNLQGAEAAAATAQAELDLTVEIPAVEPGPEAQMVRAGCGATPLLTCVLWEEGWARRGDARGTGAPT
jgi:hypothetical protein